MNADDTDDEAEALDARTSPSRLGQLACGSDALARAVARNPSATAGLLARLARRDDGELLEAVCAHPATPDAVAWALAMRFPEAFARGARGRAFLSDAHGRPPRANHLRARLLWADAPPVWFERASKHAMPRVRETAAALAPTLADDLVARLAGDDAHRVRAALARRRDLPAAWIDTLARDEHPWVREAVVLREGLSEGVMVALARDPDAWVRAAAAVQPAMPHDTLLALAHDVDTVRWSMVHNPNAPPEALEILAEVPSARGYRACSLARHPRANGRVSARLLARADDAERVDLVVHARELSDETWMRLVNDASDRVRHALAFRGDASADVLARLADDATSLVRSAVARHARTPAAQIERLARDGHAWVRACVAENPCASEALLNALARDAERDVRASVAKWCRSASVLTTLARDRETEVRLAVFFNPDTPPDVKRALDADRALQSRRNACW